MKKSTSLAERSSGSKRFACIMLAGALALTMAPFACPPQEAYAAGEVHIDASKDGYTLHIRPWGVSGPVSDNDVHVLDMEPTDNLASKLNGSASSRVVKGKDDNDKTTYYTLAELKKRVRTIVIDGSSKFVLPANSNYYFGTNGGRSGFTSVTSIDAGKIDTSNVANMAGMFRGCPQLSSLNVSGWDTSKVQYMQEMFQNCGVTSLDLRNWDTSKVGNMSNMFDGASRLSSITFLKETKTDPDTKQPIYNGFKTDKVTNMSSMFADSGVTSLDLRSFTTGATTNMNKMFEDCKNLSSVDLTSFKSSSDMADMFDGCKKLTTIKLGNGFATTPTFPGAGTLGAKSVQWKCDCPNGYWDYYNIPTKHPGTFTAILDAKDKKPEKEEQQPGTPTVALITPVSGPMFRMYNPNSGEHFYTGSEAERNNLVSVGWIHEGTGWVGPEEGAEVYRLYNPNTGDHHYTPNAAERNMLVGAGWKYEGAGWYSSGDVPVYRQYNPNAKGAGSHNYTTNAAERDMLISKGWRDEGIGWYTTA